MPRELPDGRQSHIKTPEAGDVVYMVGGRVGYDGIHEPRSPASADRGEPSSAVQIGDPITQKKMIDMLLEARDAGLIQVITDNGAGGLSSSVGEMAELTGGADWTSEQFHSSKPDFPLGRYWSPSPRRMTVGVGPKTPMHSRS